MKLQTMPARGMERFMSRIRTICGIGIALLAIGCTQKSGPTKPKPTDPPLYGAQVVPRVSEQVDPLLVDAYQALDVDGNQIGHFALSWAEVEQGLITRNWSMFDPHVEQARRHGMKLSIVLEFVHGEEGEAPAWRWPVFPDWDDPTLRSGLAAFLRELAFRADGMIAYLWLGEGLDRHAALYAGNDAQIAAFYAAIADSARAAFPNAAIGTMISPRLLGEDGKESLIREVLGSLESNWPLSRDGGGRRRDPDAGGGPPCDGDRHQPLAGGPVRDPGGRVPIGLLTRFLGSRSGGLPRADGCLAVRSLFESGTVLLGWDP